VAAPDLTFVIGTANSEQVYGGLPDGYFITDAAAADRLALYRGDAPGTRLGSAITETNSLRFAQNTAGAVYMTAFDTASTAYLAQVSNSGTVLTVGTAGTFTQVPSRVRVLSLSYDGTEAVVYNSTDTKFLVLDTADASVIGDTTLTGHTSTWIWDGPTDTLLDTYSWPSTMSGSNPKQMRPVGTDRIFFAMLMNDSADPQNYWIGVLSTASDTLTIEWDDTLVTDWDISTVAQAVIAAGEGFAIVGPSTGHNGTAASLYAIDTTMGEVKPTTASTDVGTGAEQFNNFVAAGTDYLVYADGDSPFEVRSWSMLFPTLGFTYLRQRQSPVRTPSRVRGVDLRQRQTPIIT
jgi:hypothetical protein